MNNRYDTLILNKLYFPLYIVPWQRSISLLYQELARSLDKDLLPYKWNDWVSYSQTPDLDETYYRFVNSSRLKVVVPDILVLSKYDKLPRRDIKFTRQNVIVRDKYICAYCGKKFKMDKLTIDHIVPKSRGGTNQWDNTVSACKPCNSTKADRTPQEAGMSLLFTPTEPKWLDAFTKTINSPNIRPNWSTFLKYMGV